MCTVSQLSVILKQMAGKCKDSLGRSYYAIFTAVRAVLAKEFCDAVRNYLV